MKTGHLFWQYLPLFAYNVYNVLEVIFLPKTLNQTKKSDLY